MPETIGRFLGSIASDEYIHRENLFADVRNDRERRCTAGALLQLNMRGFRSDKAALKNLVEPDLSSHFVVLCILV